MCEPLQNKKLYKSEIGDDYHYFMYEDVKSAVEFYQKYYNTPHKLPEEHIKPFQDMVIKRVKETCKDPYTCKNLTELSFWFPAEVSEVFVKYCFGDVIE